MDEALNTTVKSLVEYGLALTMCVFFILICLYAIKTLYERNQQLGDNVIASLNENTKALTDLSERIKRG